MPFTFMSFLASPTSKKESEPINYFFTDQDDDLVTGKKGIKDAKNTDNNMSGIKTSDVKAQQNDNPNKITNYQITISPESSDGKNHIQSDISKTYQRTKNPYIQLLEDFNNEFGGQKRLRTSDFMYLRDIGVYPINRMMILRRFNTSIPGYDLNPDGLSKNDMSWADSTVIGWVKPDDNLFNFSFNEVWKTQSKWLHDLIREIINDQFGIDVANIFPIPGWGQGFLFGMLNDAKMTDYSTKTLPLGDANLLREGVTRESEGQGIKSNFSFKLETCYELKYVNGVDPTVVFHNIMKNLTDMGTSDMNFLFKGGSSLTGLMKLVDNPNVGDLVKVITTFIGRIISGLKVTMNTYKKKVTEQYKKGMTVDDKKLADIKEQQTKEQHQKDIDFDNNARANANGKDWTDHTNTLRKYDEKKANQSKIAIANKNAVEQNNKDSESKFDLLKSSLSKFDAGEKLINLISGEINTILVSTIGRYKWPIRGAINQSTGMVVTPWHLTIGNPYSPVISMNNIKVDNVEITFGKEMMFNDLPKYIHVVVNITQARDMGKQEIMRMFGVTYKRNYKRAFVDVHADKSQIDEYVKTSGDESNRLKNKKK